MKKIITGLCVAILCATPVFAKTDETIKTTTLTGPYLGIYGGYDWTDLDTHAAGLDSQPHGWDGGVFAGYKIDGLLDSTQRYGIGGGAAVEAFYGISNSDDNVAGINVEKENEWGVSLRPGLSFLDSAAGGSGIAPYGILGYRNTKFTASSGAIGGSERYDGFELGIGTELIAMSNAGIRVEYSHVWYGSEGGIDPATDDVRIGLSMHF
ncbi:MAG: outer membrane beta-barrel protein [Alphaproteobacteria bacterium]